jgi:hypothetical protein
MFSQYCADVPKERPRHAAVSVRDAAFPVHDQADAVRRHAGRLRQPVDADLFIPHVFEQDLARVNRRQPLFAFSGGR